MSRDPCNYCCQPGQLGLTRDSYNVANLQILCQTLTDVGELLTVSEEILAAIGLIPGESAALNATTTVLTNTLQIKASAGKLFGFSGYTSLASGTQWIQVHDAATTPANGSVPKVTFPINALGGFSYNPGLSPRSFAIGIFICCSTTGPTKTSGSSNCWFDCQYT